MLVKGELVEVVVVVEEVEKWSLIVEEKKEMEQEVKGEVEVCVFVEKLEKGEVVIGEIIVKKVSEKSIWSNKGE